MGEKTSGKTKIMFPDAALPPAVECGFLGHSQGRSRHLSAIQLDRNPLGVATHPTNRIPIRSNSQRVGSLRTSVFSVALIKSIIKIKLDLKIITLNNFKIYLRRYFFAHIFKGLIP